MMCPKSWSSVQPAVDDGDGHGVAICPGCTKLVATLDGELVEHEPRTGVRRA